jgi:hypothetical protein
VTSIDAWLEHRGVERLSLSPERRLASNSDELVVSLASGTLSTKVLGASVLRIVSAIVDNYPENLFWDLDLMVAELARVPSERELTERTDLVVSLMRGFGVHGEISFRYVHDFTYGYDWCKWVRREPEARRFERPFGLGFLSYLDRRRAELLGLIEADDATYGRLPSGERRNPFEFSREPRDELLLHRSLAESGDIPIEAWNATGYSRFNRDFVALRSERARALGLT